MNDLSHANMDLQLTPHAFRGQILGNNSNYLTNSELLSLRWSLLFQIIKMQFAINCHLISIVPHLHCLLFDIQLSTVHILLIILQIIVNSYLLFDYKYFLINLLELILFDIWKELVGRAIFRLLWYPLEEEPYIKI